MHHWVPVRTADEAFNIPGYPVMATSEVKAYVLANCGAWPGDRDVRSQLMVDNAAACTNGVSGPGNEQWVKNDGIEDESPRASHGGTGGGLNTQDDLKGLPGYDADGWPDIPVQTGVTFKVVANPHALQPGGYTALEEQLHGHLEAANRGGTE